MLPQSGLASTPSTLAGDLRRLADRRLRPGSDVVDGAGLGMHASGRRGGRHRRCRRPRRSRVRSAGRRAAETGRAALRRRGPGTRRFGSSHGPYAEYRRSVQTLSPSAAATWRQSIVAEALATAYALFGSTASSSAGARSLRPYSELEPVLTNASTSACRAGFEQVRGADDVGAEDRRRDRSATSRRRGRQGGGSTPGAPSATARRDRVAIGQVELARSGRRPSSSASRQQSEPGPRQERRLVPVVEQPPRDVRADEPRGSGDEDALHGRLPVTARRSLVACPTLTPRPLVGSAAALGLDLVAGAPRRRRVEHALDDVRGPALDLVVDVREVRADDGEAEELDPAEEEDHDEERREALRRERRIDEPKHDLRQRRDDRKADRDERQPRDQVERRVREREHGATRPLDVPDERVGRRAVRSLGPDVRDAGLAKADPGAQAADEPVGLGQLVEGVDHAPVEQGEVAGVERNRTRRPWPGTGDRTPCTRSASAAS